MDRSPFDSLVERLADTWNRGDGRTSRWREWQHLDDQRDWETYLRGPAG